MLHVKSFGEYTKNFMEPGNIYSSIPYDYDGTVKDVLLRFDQWLKENTGVTILSIQGPYHKETKGAGCAPSMYTELTVLYKDNRNWDST